MKTKFLALLLVIVCVAGLFPLAAMAADNDTIKLDNFEYTGLSYTSATLGSSSVHPMSFSYNGGAEGFCADHGKAMGTSLIGQTYGNRTKVTDSTVLLFMAYYYSHTTASFTGEAIAKGLDSAWDGEYTYLMNAWVQAIVWRYRTGTMSDPVVAAAEELRDIYKGLKGAWAASIDDPMPGSSCSYREFTQAIFDQGTATWGEAEAYIYAFTGAGSVEHPASTVQSIIVGSVKSVITPEPVRYSLTVRKVDSANMNNTLSGAKFYVEKVGASGKHWSIVTGPDGTYTISDLDAGTYAVTETDAPAGYTIDNAGPQYVSLPSDGSGTAVVTFKDTADNPPSGDIRKVDKDHPDKGLAGATIVIEGVDNSFYGEFQTGAGGVLEGVDWESMSYGSYKAYEIAAPEGYILDPQIRTFHIDEHNTSVRLVFTNDAKVRIQLLKLNELGAPLSGAVFNILRDGQIIATEATDAGGKITVSDVTEGLYTFAEVSAPAGYARCEPVMVHVDHETVTGGGTVTVTAQDLRLPTLTIEKRDKMTGKPVPDTVFTVRGARYGYAAEIATGLDGKAVLKDLPVDSYEVREISVPDPYVLDESSVQTVWIGAGTSQTLIFENLTKPALRIVKYDEQTMAPLSDTTFEVYCDTELLGTYSTNASGEILLYDLRPGTYLVKEIAVKPGYVVNSTPQEIELKAGDMDHTIVFLNLMKPGIHLIKIDAQAKEPLPGARFRISRIGGSFSKEYVTDDSGEIDLTGLEPGSYLCEELTAPDHYLIDDALRTIRINAGENARFVFTDTRKPSLTVIKYDANLDKRLSGATFRVSRIEDGSHYLDRITEVDGSFTITDLEPGVYSVMELGAPAGYVRNVTEYHVELFPGQNSQLIVNNEKKPGLKIIKADAVTGAPIAGAAFTVRKIDSSTLLTETTDKNGEILLTGMDPGVYEITEQYVPNEYLLDPIPQQITLEPDKLGVVQFQDYKKPGLTIRKIDSASGRPVEGARFRILYASNHTFTGEVNDLGEYYSDENGLIHLDRLRDGWYRIEELEAPDGYRIKDSGVQECYIAAGMDKLLTFENVPLSTILIQKMDEETGKPLSGAVFRMKYLNAMTSMDGTTLGEYATDENGRIEINDLDEGTYVIEEVSAPAGYMLSEAGPRTVYLSGADQDFISVIYGNQKMGSLLITKKDALTGAPLPGVEFFVTDSDGAVIGSSNGKFTTDYAGSILISNIEPGKTVVVRETRAVSGYILDDVPQAVKIRANETVTLEFRNQPKGTLIVQKLDSATGEPLTGAEFKIVAANGELTADNEGLTSTNGIYRTDSNGQIVLEKLNPGAYVVTETHAPDGYVLIAQPQTVVVNPGDTQTLFFGNPPKGSLTIHKLDSLTGAPLEGCQFKITYADGKVVDNGKLSSNGLYTTDQNGQIVISGITGTLIVTEVKTIPGYVIDPETRSQTIVVNPDDAQSLTFYNDPKGTLIVQKLDKVTGRLLPGAEFKIVSSTGELLADNEGLISTNGIYVTDENGQIILPNLTPATYIVTETKAPEGYALDSTPQTVRVNTADTQTLNFYNEPLATLTIIKRDVDTKALLAGAAFTVKDGAGNPVGDDAQYVTGIDGTVTLTGLAPNLTVVVEEAEPPMGYWNGSNLQTAVLKSGALNSVTFENRKLGTLIIRKFIEGTDNEPLKGVAFRVTASDGTDIGPDGGVYYTDARGEIVLNDLQPDITVTVREIRTVDGFILDGTPQSIRIIGGKTQQLTFWNAAVQSLTIRKYEAGTTTPLEGVSFLVTDSSGAVLGTNNGEFTTDRNGRIVISGLEPDVTVTAREIRTIPGYVLDSTPQSILIKAGEAQTLTFYNERKGGLIIRKIDSLTGAPLEGAEFRITTIDGRYVDDNEGRTSTMGLYYTDRFGEIRLTDLAPDTYVVRETGAPEGYVLSDEEQSVRVSSNDTQTLTFRNEPLQSVVIQKYIEGTTKPLAGVTFLVTDGAGDPIGGGNGEFVTDESGRIVLTGLNPGMIVIAREIRTVKGYTLNGAPQTIVVGMTGSTSGLGTIPVSTAAVGNQLTFYDEPLSTLIIRKYIEGTDNEPLPGVAFKVTDGNGGAVGPNDGVWYTNSEGEIIITGLEQGQVITVREVKTVDGYILSGIPKQVMIKSCDVHELVFWNARLGALTIRALDSATMQPIEGVTFKVTTAVGAFVPDKDGKLSSNGLYKTDEAGELVISGVTGTFVVSMVDTVPGYSIHEATQSQTIVVNPMDTQALTAYCDPLQTLQVQVFEKGTVKPLAGIRFKVTSSDGTVVGENNGEYVADRNGQFTITGMKPGVTITVREVESISGYLLNAEPQSILIRSGEMQTLTFFNEKKGNLIIKLKDKTTGQPIIGAEFRITTISGVYVDDHEGLTSTRGVYRTDENGEIRLMLLESDTYEITQLSTDDTHVMDSLTQSVLVRANDTQTVEFENSALQTVIIQKYIEGTNKPLAGVTFLITDGAGTPIGGSGEYVTDANGRIVLTGLTPGMTIVAREVRTVKGYALNSEPQTIIVSGAAGQIVTVPTAAANGGGNQLTFYDEQLNTLTIRLYEEGTDYRPLEGAEFKVTDGSGAAVGNSNGIFYTDRSGSITITNLERGTVITVCETRAPDGFVLDGTPQTIEIRGSGEANELVFWNGRHGALVIRALDSVTRKPLVGVEFRISYADGRYVEAVGGKLSSNGIYNTNRYGEIRITGITGTVVVTQETVLPGYTMVETSQTAVVKEDATATLTFYNSPAGSLQIIKSDADTGERIKGVQFEIRKMNGEIIGTYTTDRNGIIYLPAVEAGWYTVLERKAADGYKLDTTPAQIHVSDGQTATLEITNQRMASIMIHKIDSAAKTGIYGVKFVLYDAGKNPIGEYTTDQDGYIWIRDDLPEGKYFLRELEAAPGYMLDTQYKTIYVERAKCAQIEWENTLVTGQIQIRKYAAEANTITGQPAGAALEGAVYEITRVSSGSVVGYIVTDAHGVAASEPLPLGRYYVTEVSAPAYYQLSGERMEAEIEYPGQIIRLSDYNKPVTLGAAIRKVGNKEVMPGNVMRYDFSDIANTSNVALNSFYWHDRIPTDATDAVSLTTGTYNQRLYYRITFKTNVNDYRVLVSNLLTSNNYSVSLTPEALSLGNGEYVTDIRFEFGTVPSGFACTVNPTLQVRVKRTAVNGYSINNRADAGGQYLKEWETAQANWITAVYRVEDTSPLPKTGY